MSYPPNCGERYQHLLVPDPPWWGPTEFDYAAAIEQSYAINRELVSVWNDIFWKDEARNDYTVTERWRSEYDNWLAEWQNVPEPWSIEFYQDSFSWDLGNRFDEVRKLVSTGACLLDAMVTDGQKTYGADDITGPPAPSPEPPPEPGALDTIASATKTVAGIVGVVLMLAVAWAVYQQTQRSSSR